MQWNSTQVIWHALLVLSAIDYQGRVCALLCACRLTYEEISWVPARDVLASVKFELSCTLLIQMMNF